MTCETLRGQFDAWLLSADRSTHAPPMSAQLALFEDDHEHLSQCAACQAFVDETIWLDQLVHTHVAHPQSSSSFADRVLAELHDINETSPQIAHSFRAGYPSRNRAAQLLSGLALVLMISLAVMPFMEPTPNNTLKKPSEAVPGAQVALVDFSLGNVLGQTKMGGFRLPTSGISLDLGNPFSSSARTSSSTPSPPKPAPASTPQSAAKVGDRAVKPIANSAKRAFSFLFD